MDDRLLFSGELESGSHAFQTLLVDVAVSPGTQLTLIADDGRGGNGEHHAMVWGDPILRGTRGELSLLDVHFEHATSHAGNVVLYRAPAEPELLLGGRPLDAGLLVHTKSVITLRVPEGYDRLVAECGFDGASLPLVAGTRSRCAVYAEAAAVAQAPSLPDAGRREPPGSG
jgi:hypothetical protein